MKKSERLLEHMQRHGSASYQWIQRLNVRNPPDLVYQLRRKGYGIETIMAKNSKGVRYVKAYAYHSGATE